MIHTIALSACAPTTSGLVIDASTAGLKPGEWPQMIRVESDDQGSRTYFRMRFDSKLGEVTGARYTSNTGHELVIIND
jgi:hypothetical protein